MSQFNIYDSDGECLTRVVITTVDLKELPLNQWTTNELGKRLAKLYPQMDGEAWLAADVNVIAEVEAIKQELTERGFVWNSNLIFNERNTGWGWLPGFDTLPPRSRSTG